MSSLIFSHFFACSEQWNPLISHWYWQKLLGKHKCKDQFFHYHNILTKKYFSKIYSKSQPCADNIYCDLDDIEHSLSKKKIITDSGLKYLKQYILNPWFNKNYGSKSTLHNYDPNTNFIISHKITVLYQKSFLLTAFRWCLLNIMLIFKI